MKNTILTFLLLGMIQLVYARPPKYFNKKKPTVTYRADCQLGNCQLDLDINNVRARLLSRGDMWWDYNEPGYEVPKGGGVSTIGAGALWMGGVDKFGNLKLAATTYATDDKTDYYPGPLGAYTGDTDPATCSLWDRKFVVYGAEIEQFRMDWQTANDNGTFLSDSQIPYNIKAYPARGNPFYTNGFDLPDQSLAPFSDRNEDGIYNPYAGDFPVLGRFGNSAPSYADEMIFQIFNDNGGLHTNSLAGALRMEIQQMSFAFNSEDFLENTTFDAYKLLNRSNDTIYDTYFSLWVDGDIGCSEDDFVGIDTTRDLVYFYNAADVDGNCMNTYGSEIPIQGVRLLRSPLNADGDEVGLTSFIYYNNSNSNFPTATTDPEVGIEYYHYMQGVWKDGSPLYGGGDAYQLSPIPVTKFAFPSAPNNENGWSMAQENLEGRDLRGVLSSGPFKLRPGITNEFIISLSTVLDVKHPRPTIKKLQVIDSLVDYFLLEHGCFVVSNSSVTPIELSIYPNPTTSDIIHIQSSENIANVQLQLISMSGQVVLSQKVDSNRALSIRHLPQGIYGYQVLDSKGKFLASGTLVKN